MNQDIGADLTSASDVDECIILSEIDKIQTYLQSFEYNYLGQPFFVLKRSSKTVSYIHEQAKLIIQCKLPIQCVEAVFIGCLLTSKPYWRFDGNCSTLLTRIPVSFKSKFQGKTYRHIVLFLKYQSKWGSIGMSRRSTLMNKPMIYTSLLDLLKEFQSCYNQLDHRLCTIYLGSPIPHVNQDGNVLDNHTNNSRSDKVYSTIKVNHRSSKTNNLSSLLKCPVHGSNSSSSNNNNMPGSLQSTKSFNNSYRNCNNKATYIDYASSNSVEAEVKWRAYKLILRHNRVDELNNHSDQINQYLELYNILL